MSYDVTSKFEGVDKTVADAIDMVKMDFKMIIAEENQHSELRVKETSDKLEGKL